MDGVARLPATERAALFNETGAALGVANAIIEKDFWVCWSLKRLFSVQGLGSPGIVFKGGTSLSKAYGAIRRFSEDVDLSLDRRDLGYGGDRDPEMGAMIFDDAPPSFDEILERIRAVERRVNAQPD